MDGIRAGLMSLVSTTKITTLEEIILYDKLQSFLSRKLLTELHIKLTFISELNFDTPSSFIKSFKNKSAVKKFHDITDVNSP